METEIKKYDEIDDAAEYLDKISQYEGSEQGEMWLLLATLWISYRDYISDDFQKILEKEIMTQVDFIYENYELVTEEHTYTRSDTSLQWKD